MLQDLSDSPEVVQVLSHGFVRILRDVIHSRPGFGLADREVVFGSVAGSLGTFATRFATGFVAFDERATQESMERRKAAQQSFALDAEGSNG